MNERRKQRKWPSQEGMGNKRWEEVDREREGRRRSTPLKSRRLHWIICKLMPYNI